MSERSEHFFGKYRGVVADNQDPDQLGRLKLKVPSVLSDAVTTWAWPCAPYGGADNQGFFFIPDVGADVWVEFEEGNLDLPIWVGTFWSKKGGQSRVPSDARNMDQNDPARRVLKTACGHVVELCDISGKETVRIAHTSGALMTLDEKGSVIIANKKGSLVYLNADRGEIAVIDEAGNSLRLGGSNATLTNKDGSVVDVNGKQVQVIAKDVLIRSDTVALGEGAMEPAILGMSFAAIYDAHTHMTAFGPSSPPIPVPMPLSVPTNPALSKSVKVK
jgi:uncharacterized protein involved in type VI secretion and phage assembly